MNAMIDDITPVILTYNEQANIGRCIERLLWAGDIIVVDSFSCDETVRIASRFAQVRIFRRKFDNHSDQWNYAVKETGIKTQWILALDADYILTEEFIDEIRRLKEDSSIDGFESSFIYCVGGRRLRASLYPPGCVLFRNQKAHYVQEGHTQRVRVNGRISRLASRILHDDRKPLESWLDSQRRYAAKEADYIRRKRFRELNFNDRIRKMRVIAPALVFFYCCFAKGLILDGKAGLYYCFQRAFAELLLSIFLIESDLLKVNLTGAESS